MKIGSMFVICKSRPSYTIRLLRLMERKHCNGIQIRDKREKRPVLEASIFKITYRINQSINQSKQVELLQQYSLVVEKIVTHGLAMANVGHQACVPAEPAMLTIVMYMYVLFLIQVRAKLKVFRTLLKTGMDFNFCSLGIPSHQEVHVYANRWLARYDLWGTWNDENSM